MDALHHIHPGVINTKPEEPAATFKQNKGFTRMISFLRFAVAIPNGRVKAFPITINPRHATAKASRRRPCEAQVKPSPGCPGSVFARDKLKYITRRRTQWPRKIKEGQNPHKLTAKQTKLKKNTIKKKRQKKQKKSASRKAYLRNPSVFPDASHKGGQLINGFNGGMIKGSRTRASPVRFQRNTGWGPTAPRKGCATRPALVAAAARAE